MNRLGSLNNTQKTSGLTIIYDLFPEGIPLFSMRIKVPNVANNQSTYGFVILSERSESKDLLASPSSTVKLPERSFDCALRAPLRMTYVSVIPAFTVFGLLIRIQKASLYSAAENVIFGKKITFSRLILSL